MKVRFKSNVVQKMSLTMSHPLGPAGQHPGPR